MAAPATTDEFLEVVRKSGVVDEARLTGYVSKLAAANELPVNPKFLVEMMVRDGLLSNFQADQLIQGKWKRFFIGKYKVLERIGSGGMGQVFLCEHKLMRRRVAVKVLPLAKSNDPASLERFYREARAVAALDHANIVRAYDIDQDDNLHFLVMEFVDGTNLQDLVKNTGPLDIQRAAHYVYGALVGLQHAHEMGLVHRDMKPGNILVDRGGVVKVLDMGLARFFHDETDQLTRKYDENILGTADYLAPEQAVDSHTVDIRADIYAMGATFYFLLTGEPPFPEGTVADKLKWHQTKEPTPIRTYRPDVPAELLAVIAKMMAKDPAKRYASPSEAIRALLPWIRQPIAPPDSSELPTLSPAASGASNSVAARGSGAIKPPTGNRQLNDMMTPSSGMPGAHLLNDLQTKSAATTITTAPQTPSPMVLPVLPVTQPNHAAPHAAAPVNIWGDVVGRKSEPMQSIPAQAMPQANQAVQMEQAPFAQDLELVAVNPAGRPWKMYALLAVASLVTCAAVVAGGFFFLHSASKDEQTQAAADLKKWYVSKNATGPNASRTKTTLRAAIEQAGNDDTIVLLDDTLDEPPFRLSDAGKGIKRGIKIEAGNASNSVVWTPKTNAPRTGPAFEISYVESLSIRNLVIDLADSGECGIVASFNCPGLTLENVTVKNPRICGFRFVGLTASTAKPVRLTGCRVTGTNRFNEGLHISAGNRNLIVTNNRFEGPGESAIKIEGAVQDSEIRNNRFWNFDTGLWFTGKLPADMPFSLMVTNNTFHTITAVGVHFDQAPKDSMYQFTLAKNFFARTRELTKSTMLSIPGLVMQDNGRDGASGEGKFRMNAIPIEYNLPVGKQNQATEFLKSDGTHLTNVGPNKVTVGYLPE